MPSEFRAASNKLRHDNHTAPGSLTERSFSQLANFLIIYNSDSSNAAEVSFDGTNTFPIPALSSFSIEVSQLKSYWTKATAGSPALKVLFGSEI